MSSSGSAPISFSGIASGLNTSSIIEALLSAERTPITRLTHEEEKLGAVQQTLQSLQGSLNQLAFSVQEFALGSSFESTQSVTSSNPALVAATATVGAGVGAYEVEVTQLASSSRRTFTFKSPAAEDTITIEGREYKLKAGGTAQELASAINSDGSGKVTAALLGSEALVLSTRATGAPAGEYATVTDPGGTLTEQAGSAHAGKNAEFKVDGVAGTSATNTVTTAIGGVTLTLGGLTTTSGPVTVSVLAPALSPEAIEAKVKSFVSLYNSTVGAIEKQLKAKAVSSPQNATEMATGALFGDESLGSLVNRMRQTMYQPIEGLTGVTSPFDIGISTGGAGGSQSSLEGQLQLNSSKLAEMVKSNPEGVEKMLQQWSKGLEGIINGAAAPGGTLEARITGDTSEIAEMRRRVATMNEMLAVRQKALQRTYAQLEAVISHNTAQTNYLGNQTEQLNKSGL